MPKIHLPKFRNIFFTSVILLIIGLVGIACLVFLTLPTLGPRWLFFFFLTIGTSGFMLPSLFFINRRIAKKPVTESLLLREALLAAVLIDLIIWLQLGRVLTPMIFLLLIGAFLLLEFFLRLSEGAVFQQNYYE